jgi:hypothetical protein
MHFISCIPGAIAPSSLPERQSRQQQHQLYLPIVVSLGEDGLEHGANRALRDTETLRGLLWPRLSGELSQHERNRSMQN